MKNCFKALFSVVLYVELFDMNLIIFLKEIVEGLLLFLLFLRDITLKIKFTCQNEQNKLKESALGTFREKHRANSLNIKDKQE